MSARLQIAPDASPEVQMAAVIQEIANLGDAVERIEGKIDEAITCKADASYVAAVDNRVTEIRGWLWGLVIAVGISMIGTLGALALALIKAQ